MTARTVYGILATGLLFAPWLGAQPTTSSRPSTAPARETGIPLWVDARSGAFKIGRPPAPFVDELFLCDGKKTSPAPPEIIVPPPIRLGGFEGRYPVPVGAGVTPPLAGSMWGIYTDCTLDLSRIDRKEVRSLAAWRILSKKGEKIASIAVNFPEENNFYISSAYMTYPGSIRKTAEGGPHATFVFPNYLAELAVTRNGAKLTPVKGDNPDLIVFPLEKVTRKDVIAWETTAGVKGSVCPLLLGAVPGLVEYRIALPQDAPASRPASQP